MIKRMTAGFDSLMRKYTPDPYIYAVALTVLVFLLAYFFTESSVLDIARQWGDGFWSLTSFTLQMVMILLLGYIVALSSPIKKVLMHLSSLPKNLSQAAVYATLVSLVGATLNWGFGLIISALFCKELGRRFNGKKFSILVACSYSGFLVWHGGLSGSIPLLVSTPGNFSEPLIGRLVPLTETIFAPLNVSIMLGHFIFLPILSYFLIRWNDDERSVTIDDEPEVVPQSPNTPAERWENSAILTVLMVAMASVYVFARIQEGSFFVDLNFINFALFVLAVIMHKTPRRFLNASAYAVSKVWPILIQYPLYAGIMAVMEKSGIAAVISNAFVEFATATTLPVLVYISAGLVNVFIPSGGGQWAVQGPMVIAAAKEIGANLDASMMAVAWGDSWTNMIQPFWALPLLAIAGLKAKDIMSSLVFVFLLSGIITATSFMIFL